MVRMSAFFLSRSPFDVCGCGGCGSMLTLMLGRKLEQIYDKKYRCFNKVHESINTLSLNNLSTMNIEAFIVLLFIKFFQDYSK